MDFHMSMSDMWLEYMVARNMNSSLSWSVLPHLPLNNVRSSGASRCIECIGCTTTCIMIVMMHHDLKHRLMV